jgi:cell division protein FtsQ
MFLRGYVGDGEVKRWRVAGYSRDGDSRGLAQAAVAEDGKGIGGGTVIASTQERFAGGRRKGPQPVAPRRPRRDVAAEQEVAEGDGGYNRGRKRTGVRLTFRGGLPETIAGRVIAGVVGISILGAVAAGAVATHRVMLRDQRFVIPGSSAIETVGNERLSRAEMLGALRGDVGRNVFHLSLDQEKATLEAMPWVERATVMRLLPDHLRASVVERTPIAFVREKGQIGLVDAHGVLLDLRQPGGQAGGQGSGGGSYSFPVVTGVVAADPVSVRAARMKIFAEFMAAMDATGERISAKLSEVDLSNPEDVKALIPDNGAEVMVHFGDADYLERYRKYEAHLAEWRGQYPKLASVDMRYDRQAVLEMRPGSDVPVNSVEPTAEVAKAAAAVRVKKGAKPEGHEGHGEARVAKPVAVPSQAIPEPSKGRGPRFGGAVRHLAAKAVHR